MEIRRRQILPKLCHTFNHWLKMPGDKLNVITDLVELLANYAFM
jgi:hypothetical protein